MRFVLQLLAVVAVSVLGNVAVTAASPFPALALAAGLAVAVAAVFTYRFVVARTERRDPDELGRWTLRHLPAGTAAGVALFAAVVLGIAVGGGYHVTGWGTPAGALGLVGFMAAVAVTEEVLYRGVLFRHVEGWFGTWPALVSVGLFFGLAHLVNPHATLWGALAIAVEAGGMLAMAYVVTRTLWLPIGLHFGWNVAASAIFSTEVSGNGTPQGLLDATTSGPLLLSGGDFGPEASLLSVIFCLAVTAVLYRIARRRGHLVPARRPGRATADTLAA